MASFKKIFRLWPAWVLSLAMLMVVYALAPQQLSLLAYKAAFVTIGAINGYWLHVWTLGHIVDSVDFDQPERWRRTGFMIGTALAYALAA